MSLPASLETIIKQFQAAPASLRVPLLLEYADKLPDPPEQLHASMERVAECQSPLFISSALQDGCVTVYARAPKEAATTRGFASIIVLGLQGLPKEVVLELPEDFHSAMGLDGLISPLRLRSMQAIMRRLKRQLRESQTA